MTTARQTRLLRTPNLQTFQCAIRQVTRHADPWRTRQTAVLVPTEAAAGELRRTLEDLLVRNEPPGAVLVLPELVTRDDWYRRQHACLVDAPPLLSATERQVLATAASKEALDEATPPFQLRPGLIPAILDFYDALMRHKCSIDAFERLLIGDLEPNADVDRGARRLLRQTRFLAAMFRAYRRRIERASRLDEHELRQLLLLPEHKSAYKQVVVTVPDWAADPTGLWPADFDLLMRLPGLEQIDIVATEAMLGAGLDKRLADLLPEINELRVEDSASQPPILIAPDVTPPRPHFMWRDREEELLAIVRILKAQTAATEQPVVNETVAIIFQQPLPYLYLARQLLQSSGVPFETHDTLPLAAEPYAAAVEMISVVVGDNYSRESLIPLLHSPHFHFKHEGHQVESEVIETLDRRLRAMRYTGGHDVLARLAATWDEVAAGETEPARSEIRRAAPALAVATGLATELCALEGLTPASNLLGTLLSFLRRHAAPLDPTAVYAERAIRARTAIWQSIDELQQAHKLLSDADPQTSFAEAVAMVRRRIENKTFDPNIGTGGVQLMDAKAATYGRFRELFLVGLIEGEWPDRPDHNIFYPASMLASVGWPRARDRLRNARAKFSDLIHLPSKRVSLSTFTLEDDVAVTPSSLLEDLSDVDLAITLLPEEDHSRVNLDEALSCEPSRTDVLSGPAVSWLEVRRSRANGSESDPRFHGEVGPCQATTYATRALEQYLECPFKYFAQTMLKLEEDDKDEQSWTVLERGLFLHRVFETFFRRWQAAGQKTITLATLEHALDGFREIVDEALANFPAAVRAVTRAWLLGSPAAAGLAERLFLFEVNHPGDVLERLIEFRIEGTFDFADGTRHRQVAIRGVADRIDLLTDGTFRVLDYKSNRAPNWNRAIQLPVYAHCLESQLTERDDREWQVGAAAYVAFGDPRLYVPLAQRDLSLALARGEARLLDVLEQVEAGTFPPRPTELHRCSFCPYPTVCRKDYVSGK